MIPWPVIAYLVVAVAIHTLHMIDSFGVCGSKADPEKAAFHAAAAVVVLALLFCYQLP